ncbi:MAG: twin-arginine translocase TatA/TatE family subunit [Myxococcota bacterium]
MLLPSSGAGGQVAPKETLKHGGAMSCGTGELIVLGLVILVVLSASRMAALGNALGKFVYSFKKAAKGEGFIDAAPPSRRLEKHEPPEDAQWVDEKKRR